MTYRRLRRRYLGRNRVHPAVVAVGAGLALAAFARPHTGATGASASVHAGGVAGRAIAYAEAQIGKPYVWGGIGPDAFDCSGLTQQAWAAAGVSIPRTSQDQWAAGPQVTASQVRPGDLVFFAGSDGTTSAPGHVGMVIGGDRMIEAYATGYPIRVSTYGTASSAPGDESPVGFTDPEGRS